MAGERPPGCENRRVPDAARASGAFPQLPWTASGSRCPPRAPQTARSARCAAGASRHLCWRLGPPARARAEAGGAGDGERRRREMECWRVARGGRQIGRPPPLGRSLRRRKGVHSDRVNRRWRRAEVPPPLPGAGSCRRQRLRGRRHLPLRQPPDLFVGRSVRASSTPYPLGSYGRGGFRGAHSLPARVLRPCTALSPTLLHFFPATNLGIRHRRPHPRSRDEDGTPRLPSPEPHPFNRQAGRACHLLDRLHPRPRSGVLLGICFGSHVQYGISKSLCSARVRMSD